MKRPVAVESASCIIDEKINELRTGAGRLAKVRGIIPEADPEIHEGDLEGSHPRCSGAQSQGQEQAEAQASEQQRT
jgi:hypothetical protein